jgi:transposase
MRGEILGMERRRFWRDEDKLEIVMSVGICGATVTQVAQRHELTRQQIYTWRHDLKKKGLWTSDAGMLLFPLDMPVAARIPVAQALAAELPPPVAIELRLCGGRRRGFRRVRLHLWMVIGRGHVARLVGKRQLYHRRNGGSVPRRGQLPNGCRKDKVAFPI